ncbi:hypothetical protein L7F22_036589 [Adiantum nelumboides]|nr:hypothetical protein [Adiantum nelumboides]
MCLCSVDYEIRGYFDFLFKDGFGPFSRVMRYEDRRCLGLFLLELRRHRESLLRTLEGRLSQRQITGFYTPASGQLVEQPLQQIPDPIHSRDEQEKELLRPEELNQQNIEALVAESNLKMEILPVNDLDVALHEFVNKDDKQAFYDCVQHNLEETRAKLAEETDVMRIKEEDLIEKVSQCMQERVIKGGSSLKTGSAKKGPPLQGSLAPNSSKGGFSDDEDADTELRGAARKSVAAASQSTGSTRGRGGRSNTSTRGRGRGSRGSLKQTTLDLSISTSRSQRAASTAARAAFQPSGQDVEDIGTSSSSDEVMGNAIAESESEPEPTPTKGRKRQAAQNKDKRPASAQKRGRKSTSSGVTRTTYIEMVEDDDEHEEDQRRPVSSGAPTQTRRSWGSLRK